ncbi:UNVERIFIED_ORG: DNA replication protein DnaC [Arthrobacter sp. UYEF1]
MGYAKVNSLFVCGRRTKLGELRIIFCFTLDDFAIKALDATETNDFYEIVVERHRRKSTIISSNREPAEWRGMTSDTLLAQSAIDRLTQAHTLVIEGPS